MDLSLLSRVEPPSRAVCDGSQSCDPTSAQPRAAMNPLGLVPAWYFGQRPLGARSGSPSSLPPSRLLGASCADPLEQRVSSQMCTAPGSAPGSCLPVVQPSQAAVAAAAACQPSCSFMLLLFSPLAIDRSKFPANDRFHGPFPLLSIPGAEDCQCRPSPSKKKFNYLSLPLGKLIVLLIVLFL